MSDTGAILAAATLVILIVVEFPIAYAFATAAMVLAFTTGRDMALTVPTAFWQTGSFALLALPLFIVAGTVMAAAEISDRLVAVVALHQWGVAHGRPVPGGQIVEHHDFAARFPEPAHHVTADVARPSRHQHHTHPRSLRPRHGGTGAASPAVSPSSS